MKIRYSKKALKFLAKQESARVSKIRQGIHGLTKSPPIGDIKPLEGYHDGTMRLRIGSFRIIYNYVQENELTLLIIEIGNRGDIYK